MPATPPHDTDTGQNIGQPTGHAAMQPIFHLLPDAPKPVTPYSHAVEAGGFLFVTGQLATDPDDDALPLPTGIEAQTRKVMDNLRRVLAGCGMSFANVVCVRIYLTDFNGDYAKMNAIFSTHFEDGKRPARTTVGVTALARGGIVEIDMIAFRS
jgi:2-iminobutanoate/2-iminopropanoate deaminase